MVLCSRGWVPKFATGLIYQIRHSSKIKRVIKLSLGQNNSPIIESFWQNKILVTCIFFEVCPIWCINPVANFGPHTLLTDNGFICHVVAFFLHYHLTGWVSFITKLEICVLQVLVTLQLNWLPSHEAKNYLSANQAMKTMLLFALFLHYHLAGWISFNTKLEICILRILATLQLNWPPVRLKTINAQLHFHRGAFCQFPFRWIYYYGSNKSTGKETGKT